MKLSETDHSHFRNIASRLISYQERTATGDLIAYGTFGYDNDDRILSRYRIPNYATAIGLESALGFYSLAKSGEIALYGGLKTPTNGGRK